jgi:hypothetical protein
MGKKVYQSFSLPIEARQILQLNAEYAGISMTALMTKLIMAHDKLLKSDLNQTQPE